MDNPIKHLYQQIREQRISREEAARRLSRLAAQYPKGSKAMHELRALLVSTAAELLNVAEEDVDSSAEFAECGFDPLSSAEFAERISQKYRIEIDAALLVDYSSIDGLADYLFEECVGVFESARGSADTPSMAPAEPPIAVSGMPEPDETIPAPVAPSLPRDKAIGYFKKLLSSVIGLPAHRIEADAPMEKYGIDSIMVMQLTNQLEKIFGSLPKTLFFEYQDIQELTDYFLTTYPEKLNDVLGIANGEQYTVSLPDRPTATAAPVKHPTGGRRRRPRATAPSAAPVEPKNQRELDIAIIGLAGRYPQAANVQAFWENLRSGKDAITEIPTDRWDHSLYFDADKNKPGKTYGKWGGFLDGVDRFDPLFFNISPREAEYLDPQERLFMQCVYEVLEDAGYTRDALGRNPRFGLGGNVGVYVGVMYEEYQLYGAQETILGRPIALSGNPSSIANRVSYFCNFHGPSMAVDTMCSSSLTTIHLACQSLQHGDCELAVAGGVNVSVHPNKYLILGQGSFISSKGRCESFGQGGDGYVPGEGVGALLLKPRGKAEADGDHIYGVIKATAINHGGKTNGYSVPNPNAQASVIGRIFQEVAIDPRTISYIEAHGTGTSLGDPIEIAGLNKAFQAHTRDTQFCAIGSAKSNIGHCESAAGIAGVTKVLMQMKHKELAPSLHSETLNPNIDFETSPFFVQQTLSEWKRPIIDIDGKHREFPRLAGVSSFGAGGSNAHVVIEEYTPSAQAKSGAEVNSPHPAIILLSAKSNEQVRQQARRLLSVFASQSIGDARLADIAYTLQVGREMMEARLALLVHSVEELKEKLERFVAGGDNIDELYQGHVKRNKEALQTLTGDEDIQTAMASWVAKGKYSKLIELWVQGLRFDWENLYGEIRPHRISLPTYPFAEERYWVPAAVGEAGQSMPAVINSEVVEARREVRFSRKQWETAPVKPAKRFTGTIAVLVDETTKALGDSLCGHLTQGQALEIAALGEPLGQAGPDWKGYDAVIDLIGCGAATNDSIAWLPWLQQLIEQGHRDGLVLLGVTRGLESYRNTEINMAGASRAGLYRMLQSEYRHLHSRHMDAELSVDDNDLVRQILDELHADTADTEVCYRQGVRYRAYLDDRMEALPKRDALVFPANRVLWITGGTRGLGYLCARHFIEQHGVRHLVLTGREIFPPRELWDSYVQSDTAVARKIRAIKALEMLGAHVRVLSLSLSDESAVKAALQEVRETMGPLGGVIHAAGTSDKETPAFIRKPVNGIARVFEPKVGGLDVMLRCLGDESVQFFVLFSSVSAIIPTLGVGQSDYAMANAYMDYAAVANSQHLPIVSIQWPNWKEAGMGEVKSRAYDQTGLLSLTDKEGLQLLDQVLSRQMDSVVLPAMVDPALWQARRLMQPVVQEQNAVVSSPKPHTQVATVPKNVETLAAATQEWLIDVFSTELKIAASKLDVETPFQDYGVDSILLTQLLGPVGKLVEGDLDPSILLEYPTLASLSAWLLENHAKSVAKVVAVDDFKAGDAVQTSASVVPLRAPAARQQPAQAPQEKAPRPMPSDASDIAVIGLSCRFPEADNLQAYWRLLSEGRSAIASVPPERWGYTNHYNAALMSDVTHFDPGFFLIPNEDAKAMDPQALLVLEESLNLLYHAGYTLEEVKGKATGVYLGARSRHLPAEERLWQARNPIVAIGPNYLAANVSQFFDLRGPSITLDTACSSALVAMNMAMQALHGGEIDAAIVGGVSLMNDDGGHRLFDQRGILSKEPAFHIFDQRARGIVLGEGVGMVMLKTVQQALEDGDRIHAVIKGMAINNDGRTAGPATPNLQAHKQVLKTALERSGIRAEDVGYIDVNGSGSEVTDLLELKAIQSVYRHHNEAAMGLGSIKPNIGHPLCAEGIASFIKLVLMLENSTLVPFLSGEEPMKHFNMDASPFYFPRRAVDWQGASKIGAINCFADGGTNAHVILGSWTDPVHRQVFRQPLSPPKLNRYDVYGQSSVHTAVSADNRNSGNSRYTKPEDLYGPVNIWKQGIGEA
ncbi:MAG: KR domain-containing protein [Candidatus Thiodiazotropha sp. (ex Dulcina madagascariensis)]|nr:KR domain-containing protein [Candidatus Thiodiazotropha sp. (ex Dulcina madagascariensis)]